MVIRVIRILRRISKRVQSLQRIPNQFRGYVVLDLPAFGDPCHADALREVVSDSCFGGIDPMVRGAFVAIHDDSRGD